MKRFALALSVLLLAAPPVLAQEGPEPIVPGGGGSSDDSTGIPVASDGATPGGTDDGSGIIQAKDVPSGTRDKGVKKPKCPWVKQPNGTRTKTCW